MFTALMSLALLALVAYSGVSYVGAMEDLCPGSKATTDQLRS
jgi:hypothetical protein